MSDKTGIEWTDATWNPITGCTEVSPGCDHCYAKTFAERWRGTPGHYFEHGFDVQLRPDRLGLPLRWRRPRRIFVNSMSDLFHDQIPDDYIAKVFAVMAVASDHTFQLLTKRHGRMRSLLSGDFRDQVAEEITEMIRRAKPPGRYWPVTFDRTTDDGWNVWGPSIWPLPNVWLGVSAEDQQWANIRIPALLDTPAAVRWVSAEPLLGPIDLAITAGPNVGGLPKLDWVVVGGESGRGARPMSPYWPTEIREQCEAAGIPFLFKQWGEYATSYRSKGGVPIDPWGDRDPDVMVERFTGQSCSATSDVAAGSWWTSAWRVGKKAAGRELDGRTWDQYPEVTT